MEGKGSYPKCQSCNNGVLIPLSGYGQDGANADYQMWVCSNPSCGFRVRIDNGDVTYGKRKQ